MSLQESLMSEYGTLSSAPSPVNRMMSAFACDFREGRDINLGVGYVNERTIPVERIREAQEQVLAHPDKYRFALNYGGASGSQNLIDSLRSFHLNHGIGKLDLQTLEECEIVVGANGATSLLDGLSDVLKPGIVLTSDPMYYIYCNELERKGFEVVTVPEDEEGISTDALHECIAGLGDRLAAVSFFYIVTVGNPTSTVLSNTRRRELVDIATELSRTLGRKVPLIFDKAYELLIHDPSVPEPVSCLPLDEVGLVYEIGTLSKILAPGLRIGYLMGPPGPLTAALVQRTSDVGFSAPLINQEIASYLIDHYVAEQLERVNTGYREKAAASRAAIDRALGNRLESVAGGKAGFYFYLTFREVLTTESSHFFHFLARTTGNRGIDGPPGDKHPRLIYIPGEHCAHPRGPLAEAGTRQLRLSYGFEETDVIVEALDLMREAAEFAETPR